MKNIYFNQFSNWNDVVFAFNGASWNEDKRKLVEKEFPEPDQVIYANYDGGGYDGDALVVYRNGDKYYTVEGSHCSCYGLEDQWSPEEYTLPLLIDVIKRRIETSYGSTEYPSRNKETWQEILERITS